MYYALTVYPLSAGFRERLERSVGAPVTYVSLQELRRLSPFAALGRLRGFYATRLLLPIEDENSRSVLGVLTALAGFARARRIEIVHPDLQADQVSRWRIVPSLTRLAYASVASAWVGAVSGGQLRRLLRVDRVEARAQPGRPILYLNANLWFGLKAGGSVGHVAGVVNGFKKMGRGIVYASPAGRQMVNEDVPLLPLDAPATFGFPHELNYPRFDRLAERQLLASGRYGFIYQRMSIGNFTGVRLSRRWRIPLVLEYNGSEVWVARNWGRRLRFERLALAAENACLRHAHVIVTISDAVRDEIIARHVDPARIVTYPNCVDPALFDPERLAPAGRALRHRLGLDDDAVVVTFLGTFGQWHGAEVLAKAIRELAGNDREWLRSQKVHFLLVGDGLTAPLVREILGPDACIPFVTLTGLVPQQEAPAYLSMSDVLVSPHVANADGSRFFGSPTKLFEYMAMGKAIVASDLDQIGAVLRHSLRAAALPDEEPEDNDARMALLCAPGDVEALVRAIRFAATRPHWRRALGRNARREALARYTWTHHVAAISASIERLTNS